MNASSKTIWVLLFSGSCIITRNKKSCNWNLTIPLRGMNQKRIQSSLLQLHQLCSANKNNLLLEKFLRERALQDFSEMDLLQAFKTSSAHLFCCLLWHLTVVIAGVKYVKVLYVGHSVWLFVTLFNEYFCLFSWDHVSVLYNASQKVCVVLSSQIALQQNFSLFS